MIYKAIIAEDNPVDAEVLQDYLNKYFPEIIIAAHVVSVAEIKKTVLQHAPQIVFMDVELCDGKSVEVLDSLNTENIQLIFITSHDVFAIDAIRANAVDYIVKPVDAILLKKAVFKALQRIEKNSLQPSGTSETTQKISVPTSEGFVFMDAEKIIRVEAKGSYSTIITTDAKPLLVSRTLLHFEKELPAALFMRIHDSCVVNRQYITEFLRSKTGKIKMSDGFVSNISEGKKENFFKWMQGNRNI